MNYKEHLETSLNEGAKEDNNAKIAISSIKKALMEFEASLEKLNDKKYKEVIGHTDMIGNILGKLKIGDIQ